MDIFEEIAKVKREGKRAALATIVNARGSIPSVVAAKMLVREDGSILGTVGGGCVESDVRKGAMEVMRDEKPKTVRLQPESASGRRHGIGMRRLAAGLHRTSHPITSTLYFRRRPRRVQRAKSGVAGGL